MAKILLVWNTHPNESAVTQELARLLKPLLEARGFEVEIAKIPEDLTIHFVFAQESKYKKPNILPFLLKKKEESQAQFIIDLHTTPDSPYNIRRPKFISARSRNIMPTLIEPFDAPILLEYLGNSNSNLSGLYSLEFPAKYTKARKNWRDAFEIVLEKSRSDSATLDSRVKHYFYLETDLRATKNAGYLSQRVLAKTTHLIDTEVKTRLRVYQPPRTEPFRPKTDKWISKTLAMQKKIYKARVKPK